MKVIVAQYLDPMLIVDLCAMTLFCHSHTSELTAVLMTTSLVFADIEQQFAVAPRGETLHAFSLMITPWDLFFPKTYS